LVGLVAMGLAGYGLIRASGALMTFCWLVVFLLAAVLFFVVGKGAMIPVLLWQKLCRWIRRKKE
jgi:uncharacterized membrane protein